MRISRRGKLDMCQLVFMAEELLETQDNGFSWYSASRSIRSITLFIDSIFFEGAGSIVFFG